MLNVSFRMTNALSLHNFTSNNEHLRKILSTEAFIEILIKIQEICFTTYLEVKTTRKFGSVR